ncbi:MAG: helix-turn-helix transcriptional regulator [Myxococcales bacterium]|nr:helix-turn-helix transcriptional regulator [Myxococcales bacterium]
MTSEDKAFYKALGERVGAMRKQNHLTQVQMAEELGASQQQIAAYEAGRVKIPISALPKLSTILATPIDEIVGVEKKKRRGPASKVQQQVELIGNLPRSKQKFVIEMLDTLIRQDKMAR